MKRIASLVALTALLLIGCTDYESDQMSKTIEDGGAYSKELEENKVVLEEDKQIAIDSLGEKNELLSNSHNKVDSTKILSKHEMEIETTDIQESVLSIERETHRLNGYISSNKTEKGRAISELSIKFPVNRSSDIKLFLSKNFEIVSEETNSVDASDNYFDLESRIKELEKREKRLEESYDSKRSVEEILLIDKSLYETIVEKEELIRQKLKIENRVNYSKIDIRLKEVKKIKNENKEESTDENFFIKFVPGILFSISLSGIIAVIVYLRRTYKK